MGARPISGAHSGARTVALVAVGCVAGVSLSTFVLPRLTSANASAPLQAALTPQPTSPTRSTDDVARALDLDRRLAWLEQSARSSTAEPSKEERKVQAPPPAADDDRPSGVEVAFKKAQATYGSEARDAAWAGATARSLSQDLAGLEATANFQIVAVDCKTTHCMADVAWKSRTEAKQNWQRLLQNDYQANCTRHMFLRSEPDAKGQVHGDVVFDCEEWRANRM